QEPESAFNQRGTFVRLGWRQAEPILGYRASAHVPEFDQILRGKTKTLAPTRERPHRFSNQSVFGVVGINETQQDVCVHKIGMRGTENSSSVVILVDALAAKG